jgi:multiple sugar transport system ATP-binding protein
MVFQSYALYPHMTVFENMAFALRMRRLPKAEIAARVSRAAAALGLSALLGRKPGALSGGQRQRVALGRAMVRDPACFLFDEPLSNLDARLRVEMRAEIKRLLLDLGATAVYVTHDQEEAMTIGDLLVVMKDGVIQQAGAPLEVYARPANRFVAGFLGTPAMNFLDGRLLREAGELWFEEGTTRFSIPPRLADTLDGRAGQAAVLGIRPSALGPDGGAARAGNALAVRVVLVEPLGEEMDVTVETARGARLVARLAATAGVRPGQTLPMLLDLGRAHFFAPGELGASLGASPS